MSIINLEDRRQNYHRIEHDITHSTYTDSFTTFSHIIVYENEWLLKKKKCKPDNPLLNNLRKYMKGS
jgi:hypothetical protein